MGRTGFTTVLWCVLGLTPALGSVPFDRSELIVSRLPESGNRLRLEMGRTELHAKTQSNLSWDVPVEIVFPQAAALESPEQETFVVSLKGSKQRPQIEIASESPVYEYEIKRQIWREGMLRAYLALKPKFESALLAEQTILDLRLARTEDSRFEIRFEDRGAVPRATNHYRIEIADKDARKWVFTRTYSPIPGVKDVTLPVPQELRPGHDHLLRLSVTREGPVLDRSVSFRKETHQFGQLDPTPFQDQRSIGEIAVQGQELVFMDQVGADSKVESRYDIRLIRRARLGSWELPFLDHTLAELSARKVGPIVRFSLAQLSEGQRKTILELLAKRSLHAELDVTRISPRLRGVSPIKLQIEREVTNHIQ